MSKKKVLHYKLDVITDKGFLSVSKAEIWDCKFVGIFFFDKTSNIHFVFLFKYHTPKYVIFSQPYIISKIYETVSPMCCGVPCSWRFQRVQASFIDSSIRNFFHDFLLLAIKFVDGFKWWKLVKIGLKYTLVIFCTNQENVP